MMENIRADQELLKLPLTTYCQIGLYLLSVHSVPSVMSVLSSEQKFNFLPELQVPNLHQTVVNTFLIINMSNSNNLNKF